MWNVRRRLRIVVLNDSALLLEMLCHWLEMHGHHSQPFVITTSNKPKLEHAVGAAPAIEIGGRDTDLRRVLKAVEAAADGVR